MKKFKKKSMSVLAGLVAACFTFSFFAMSFPTAPATTGSALGTELFKKADASLINVNTEQFFDEDLVYKLPSTIASNQEISVIVSLNTETILDVYSVAKTDKTISEFINTKEAKAVASSVEKQANALISKLDKSGVKYTLGERYDTVLSGFEITINSNDFDRVNNLLSSKAELIIGEVYEPCLTEVITNKVDVYDTGIFDGSKSGYKGDGVVVAVLDSGLDYTHSAFSLDGFNSDNLAFTKESISKVIADTTAATLTEGLTADDVYVSAKIPFAYDYADKDPLTPQYPSPLRGTWKVP